MLISPFQNISKPSEKKLTIILLVSLIIMFLTMRYFDAPLKNTEAPSGIISFEFAKELSKSEAILNSWNTLAKTSAGMSMGFDFLFLIIYALFFALLIHKINERLWKGLKIHTVGVLLIWCIFLAAFFDMVENVALIKLLLGDLQQKWVSVAFYFAISKFFLLAIGFIFIIVSLIFLLLKNKIVNN
ncbi:MAG: hypothetical protein Q8S41_12695 [Lutibacter sp.]|nr:hypothetical protein [Lutibacter sp.]